MKAYLYILESERNHDFYIGATENLDRRIKQHNSGNVKSTKYKRPYNIAFYKEYDSINTAKKIETKIKNWKRKDFIKKIIKDQEIKMSP